MQRNAIQSWALLDPTPEIIVFGDEEGAADACRELGVQHEPNVARTASGMLFADDLFDRAQRLASSEILCYANCDMVLCPDFVNAVGAVHRWGKSSPLLIVVQRWNAIVDEVLDGTGEWRPLLEARAKDEADPGPIYALDVFAFTRGLFDRVPPFAIGRIGWDNWMV